ncbi:hypothetical protein G8C93_13740 [Cellulosimicrobium cellulans]|uniref:hypothetical protein n=1 Tax=Cellulosimicrobium cellulans TaxID=1710 RepID=UPI0018839F88|nr:hypothetical protein [Cellulosimicrobium cellulans]MBE9926949.1 hypothetical protein [Cellulosimicrobium cellulans]
MERRSIDEEHRSARPRRPRLPVWAGASMVIVGALTLVVLLVSRLSGGAEACPAIGYSSTLEVVLTGDIAEVAHVQVLDDDGGWPPPPPTGPDASAGPTPTTHDGDARTFTLSAHPGNPVGLRALDQAGTVLAQTERNVSWVRVGGSEACGGPQEARVGWTL